MSLATVDAEGRPNVRMVLLKDARPDGFVFYTNTESAKGSELAANAFAALCFHWKRLRRQVRVRGRVDAASATRRPTPISPRAPKDSQIGAWASRAVAPDGRPLRVREGDREIRREIRAAESAASAVLARLPHHAVRDRVLARPSRSACTTGWSIAATRPTALAHRTAVSVMRPMTHAEDDARPDAPRGPRLARRVAAAGRDQDLRLFRDRFGRDAGVARRFRARSFHLDAQPLRHPLGADAGRCASIASATARPSRWRAWRRAPSSPARRCSW